MSVHSSVTLIFFCLYFLRQDLSLCNPDCAGAGCVDQTGLGPVEAEIHLTLPQECWD